MWQRKYTSQKTHIFQFTIYTFWHSEVHLALFILFVLWEYKGEQDSGEPVGCDEQKWCQGEKSVSPFPKSTIKSILIVNVLRINLNRKNHLVSGICGIVSPFLSESHLPGVQERSAPPRASLKRSKNNHGGQLRTPQNVLAWLYPCPDPARLCRQ